MKIIMKINQHNIYYWIYSVVWVSTYQWRGVNIEPLWEKMYNEPPNTTKT